MFDVGASSIAGLDEGWSEDCQSVCRVRSSSDVWNVTDRLDDILARGVLVQEESNIGVVVPVDQSDAGSIRMDVQVGDDGDGKVQHVLPPFQVHSSGRVQQQDNVYLSVTACPTKITDS